MSWLDLGFTFASPIKPYTISTLHISPSFPFMQESPSHNISSISTNRILLSKQRLTPPSQHFQKIRKAAREGGQTVAPIAGTPRKRSASGAPKTPKSGKSTGKSTKVVATGGDDDEGTPSKKRRTSAKKAATKLKEPEVEDEDEENQGAMDEVDQENEE
jgi:hypothetical protein